MRTIKVKNEDLIRWPNDCKRIQDILIDKGIYATIQQCQRLWELYSEDHWCASWLVMEGMTSDDIYYAVKEYYEEGPDSGMDTRYL
jgi:hypothetical protein